MCGRGGEGVPTYRSLAGTWKDRDDKFGYFETGDAFLLSVQAFLLAVGLLCLQSVEVLLRHTFPL